MAARRNLSADICWEPANTWRASLAEHPPEGGPGVLVWERRGMRTEHNAETAMEAAWRRLQQQPTRFATCDLKPEQGTGASHGNGD